MKKIIIILFGLVCLAAGAFLMWQNGGLDGDDIYTVSQLEGDGLISLDKFVKQKRAQELLEQRQDLEIKVTFAPDLTLSPERQRSTLPQLVKEKLVDSDFVFANINNPLEDSFFLSDNNIAIVDLANDKVMENGQDDLIETVQLLQNSEIDFCGASVNSDQNKLAIVEVENVKFGFLCYSYGPAIHQATETTAGVFMMNLQDLEKDMKKYREQVNFLIVSMHSGLENKRTVSKTQESFARRAIDLGADLVIGNGTNLVQQTEVYKNKYILYGLGNLIYPENWPATALQGVIAQVSFSLEGVKKIDFYPIKINDNQPEFISEEKKLDVLDYLKLDFEE
ncbi:CapA family protein [Candidatus Falkowbacteria bacterium]|nr:CapA family protein [Candidatus Falkowbacteria bacterium]